MKELKDLLGKKQFHRSSNVSREYQSFGVWLSEKLCDPKHKSLYIKLAKTRPRDELMKAYSFAVDYPSAKNRGKIFMWKLVSDSKKNDSAKKPTKK